MNIATCMNKNVTIFCYMITNTKNSKKYIGITRSLKQRWTTHCNPNNQSIIARAIRKYGREQFRFNLISEGDIERIKEIERHLISTLGTIRPGGYNILEGGDFLCQMPGEKNPRAIAVVINGKKYGCIKAAAEDLGVNPETLRRHVRLNGSKCTYKIYDSQRRAKNSSGRKHTFETIQKLKNRVMPKLGECYRAREIIVNGTKYSSIKEAAIAENLNYNTLRWRFNYTNKTGKQPTGRTKAKQVLVQGIEYKSITSAAKATGVTPSTLVYRFNQWKKTGEWPSGYQFL